MKKPFRIQEFKLEHYFFLPRDYLDLYLRGVKQLNIKFLIKLIFFIDLILASLYIRLEAQTIILLICISPFFIWSLNPKILFIIFYIFITLILVLSFFASNGYSYGHYLLSENVAIIAYAFLTAGILKTCWARQEAGSRLA